MDMCIIRSIVVTKCSEIGIASYLSRDGLLNLHEIWLHTDDIYLPYRVKHFDESHSSFRRATLFHLHRCIPNDSPSTKRYLYVCVCRYIDTDLYVYTSVYIQILSNNASAISQEDRPLLQKQNERIFHSYLWIFTHSRKIWRWKSTCNMQKYLKYSKYNTRSNFSIIFKRSLLEFYFIFFFFLDI